MTSRASDIPASSTPPFSGSWVQRLVREPLVHFMALGALVFAVDFWVLGHQGKEQTIQVAADALQEAALAYKGATGRDPSAQEFSAMRQRWLDNEVLYREGLSLGLDKGDSGIRERVIFKSLSVVQAGLSLPRIDEAGLKKWFEDHRERYDAPSRFDFLEATVPAGTPARRIETFAATLQARSKSQGPAELPADLDLESTLRIFKQRPRVSLVQGYGEGFVAALEKLPLQTWSVLDSKEGPRVVRLEAFTPIKTAVYDDFKDSVIKDWQSDTMSRMTTDRVRDLARKYRVEDARETAK